MNENLNIPAGYQAVMPYLIISNAEEFITFMQKVFDATEKMKIMRDENCIAHGEIIVNDCTIMFADATGEYMPCPAGMFVYVSDADATYSKALKEAATPVTEMADQSYGRSGGVQDPFGNTWWITAAK